MENENTSAKIISLDKLMSQEIGEVEESTTDEPTDKVVLDNDKPTDFLALENANSEEEEEEENQEENNSEEEENSEEENNEEEENSEEEEEEENNSEENSEEENNEEEDNTDTSQYTQSLKSLFGDDISIVQKNEDTGEEEEIALEDLEMTQELYEEILKAKISEVEEEAKRDTVSIEGLSEFTRELIEIDRVGGDVSTLLQSQETYINVLDKLDLNNESDQEKAVYLRLRAEGSRSEEEIDILIKGYKDKGVLAEKAEASDKEIRDAVAGQMAAAKEKAEEDRAKRAEMIKEYEKDIVKSLDVFELDDKIKKKIGKLAVEKDDKDRFKIDNMYFQMKGDPEKAAKLALFILDMEEHDKQVSKKVKNDTHKQSANKITIAKKRGGKSEAKQKGGKKDKDSILISDLEQK